MRVEGEGEDFPALSIACSNRIGAEFDVFFFFFFLSIILPIPRLFKQKMYRIYFLNEITILKRLKV